MRREISSHLKMKVNNIPELNTTSLDKIIDYIMEDYVGDKSSNNIPQ